MHAIIHKEDGGYYVSPVFGFYKHIKAKDEYKKYLESIHKPFYVVWNEERTRLIRWHPYAPSTTSIDVRITIIDADQSDWTFENGEEGAGCVSFLNGKDLIEKITLSEEPMDEDLYEQCIKMDEGYVYDEYPEIKSEQDLVNLEWAAGGFHDAYIDKSEVLDNGDLYLYFKGMWGCDIEIWFSGDVEYDMSGRDPEMYDPYWQDSKVILQDGFVYLVDDEYVELDKITDGYCWFKARHMKYHVIPV